MSSSENDSEEEVLQPGEEDDEEEGKGDGEENLGLYLFMKKMRDPDPEG